MRNTCLPVTCTRVSDKGEFPNLSETRRRELRLAKLAELPESQMLVFGSDKADHTITVFTDVDCPWCRRLHSQIADYNKLGIRVRYLFFPRSGPDTESWAKADAVWCSADRKDAFTRTKGGEEIKAKACAGSPVAREYKLGTRPGCNRHAGRDTGKRRADSRLSAAVADAGAYPQIRRHRGAGQGQLADSGCVGHVLEEVRVW